MHRRKSGVGAAALEPHPCFPGLPMLCGGCVLDILDPLGHARFCCEFVVLLEELVRKALL